MVKNLSAVQETLVWFLGQKDPLEKGMATHSSILAWRIPWTEEPGGLQSMGSQRVGHDWATRHTLTLLTVDPLPSLKTPFWAFSSVLFWFLFYISDHFFHLYLWAPLAFYPRSSFWGPSPLFVDHSPASFFILTFTNFVCFHGFNLCVGGSQILISISELFLDFFSPVSHW